MNRLGEAIFGSRGRGSVWIAATAFAKRKSYDRFGINCELMSREFADADSLSCHWDTDVFRLTMAEENGWTTDPYFEVDDFPRVKQQPSD